MNGSKHRMAGRVAAMVLALTGALATLAQAQPTTATTKATATEDARMWMYIGTTGGRAPNQSKGIYVCRFDPATGKVSPPELAAEARSPSFVEIHPGGKFLYATREARGAGAKGTASFAIDRASGKLTPINEQPAGGQGPCFVGLDATGRTLLVANYGSGHLASLPIAEDGSLGPPASVIQDVGKGPHPDRQEGPHAHSFNVDPTNRWALGCDLGTDQVLIFALDPATATLTARGTPNRPPFAKSPPGAGPRHLAFHPDGKRAYVINEMGCSVTTYHWDAESGALASVDTVTALPPDYKGPDDRGAEVRVHPGGRFVYASVRGPDCIAIYAVDPELGKLVPRGHAKTGGAWPRNFNIDPTGTWLVAANEHSNNLVVFRIDAETGALTETGVTANVPSPSCVRFLR